MSRKKKNDSVELSDEELYLLKGDDSIRPPESLRTSKVVGRTHRNVKRSLRTEMPSISVGSKVVRKHDPVDDSDVLDTPVAERKEHHLMHDIAKDKNIVSHDDSSKVTAIDLTAPRADLNAPGRVPQNTVMAPPVGEDGDIDLNKLFSSEIGNESDVVKELFSSENVKVKTDLTLEQISIISRLELQASLTQNFFLAKIIRELETLMISKNRMSRQEFVQSFRGVGEMNSASTVFNKLGGIFKNDKV